MKYFLIALQFLTVLPVSVGAGHAQPEEDFAQSLTYFPIVGAFIGIFLTLILFAFRFLPNETLAALILICSVVITGGIHLDGLADTCDGFYGNKPKDKILEIMRDSRIGAMGVIGIVCICILKYSLLFNLLQSENFWRIIFLAPIFGRFVQVVACYKTNYPRQEGKAKYFVGKATTKQLIFGATLTSCLSTMLLKVNGIIILVLSIIPVLFLINWFKKKIDGMTGDTIGAVSEISEILILLGGLFVN